MARARKPWVRGAVVIGIAGAMMAAALMSPALATRLATTSYVKQKVNQAFNKTFGFFLQQPIVIVRSDPLSVPPALGSVFAIACPAGGVATGGGASVGSGSEDWDLEASYPSNGASSAAGTTGWAVSMTNESTVTMNYRIYVLCAGGTGVGANFSPGATPVRATQDWPPPTPVEPEVTSRLVSR